MRVTAEDVRKAFKDFNIVCRKLEVFTSKFETLPGGRVEYKKGIDRQKFFYILKFAEKNGRITPAQKRELEEIVERLKSVDGIDLSIPARVLEEFLNSVEVKTEGIRGR